MRGRGAAGKTPVVGIVERKGKVAAKVNGDLKSSTVKPFIVFMLRHSLKSTPMNTCVLMFYPDMAMSMKASAIITRNL
jgi:hypothetical protein